MMEFSLRGGFDPLMMACERNDLEYVKSLIPHSKINHKNEKGETCLSVAVKLGFEEIVKELIQHKADVNSQNKAGQSLVYIASWYNRLEILRLLIQAGSDVNVPDNRHWTPLMIGAYSGFLMIVAELLKNGADTEKKDCFGKKAVDRAKDPRVISMLSEVVYNKYPEASSKPSKPLIGAFSVARLINDKKRGQPVNQKKVVRSQSVEGLPSMQLDVIQRRDLRGIIDERMKVITKAYEFHVSQDWSVSMDLSLETELQKAQSFLLENQENSVKKASKGLYGRLLGQLNMLFNKSLNRLKSEKDSGSKNLEDFVSSEEISEFYRYKFNSVSKEIGENITEIIINQLKKDMNDLQNELFSQVSEDINYEFSKLANLNFT